MRKTIKTTILILIIATIILTPNTYAASSFYQGLLTVVNLQNKILYAEEGTGNVTESDQPTTEEEEILIPTITIGEIKVEESNMPVNVVQIITIPVITEHIEDDVELNVKLIQNGRDIDSSKYLVEGNAVNNNTANIVISAGPEMTIGEYIVEISYEYEVDNVLLQTTAESEFEIIYIALNNIVIKQPAVSLEKGERTIITYDVIPDTFTDDDLKFTSANEQVATISPGGLITAVGRGQTTVTISSLDDTVQATCQVTVFEPSIEIKSMKITPEILKQGEDGTIELTVETIDLATGKQLDVSIQKHGYDVTSDFIIQGNSVQNNEVNLIITPNLETAGSGEYTILISFDGKQIDSADLDKQTRTFTIEGNVEITGITVSQNATRMVVGATKKIEVKLLPENAENKKLIWTSNKDEVATVDEDGEIIAESIGKATITVYSDENPEIYATIAVTVQELVVTEEYTLDEQRKVIKNIPRNTDVEFFMENVRLGADEYTIKNHKGEVISGNQLVGTNTTLSVEGQEYKTIIKGDTNGDGKITITDVAKVQLHFVKLELLEDNFIEAADMNNTSDITITDVARLQLVFLGLLKE